ncbi:MAG: four helix bundle protein [Ferruginibacter sp.]
MQTTKPNIIVDLSFKFALEIISYAEILENNRKYIMARQILRSGISIGANIREAQNAESLKDFIHKMKIAAKESDETEYWLLLKENSDNYPKPGDLISRCIDISKILSKIISTSKNKI